MITKALNQQMKANTTLVTWAGDASYFFAEAGRGDKAIVTSQNDKYRVEQNIPSLLTSPVQVLITGFDIDSGEKLGHKIVEFIAGLTRSTLEIPDWSYHVQSVVVRNEPVLIRWNNVNAFSINFLISYRQNFLA